MREPGGFTGRPVAAPALHIARAMPTLRPHLDLASDPGSPPGRSSRGQSSQPSGRLNLLLSYGGWRHTSWADQLPTLLEPLGVRAWRATSGSQAANIIKEVPVHIALVDLSLPITEEAASPEEGGERLLQLLARLPKPPPTVVVRRRTSREGDRVLATALSAGVFAVVDRPVHLETVLETMRRVLSRHYAGRWPNCCEGDAGPGQGGRPGDTHPPPDTPNTS